MNNKSLTKYLNARKDLMFQLEKMFEILEILKKKAEEEILKEKGQSSKEFVVDWEEINDFR